MQVDLAFQHRWGASARLRLAECDLKGVVMWPRVKAGILAALLAALASALRSPDETGRVGGKPTSAPSSSATAPEFSALCPKGTLPDEGVCIPVPAASSLR
jgi:hypothetical protein